MESYDHFLFLATVLFFSLALVTNAHFALESTFISLHLMYHVCLSLVSQHILNWHFCFFCCSA